MVEIFTPVGVDVTQVDTTAKHALGTIARGPDGKMYKYVLYAEGTGALDLAPGDAVFYTDDTGMEAQEVMADLTDASGDPIPAGIVMATVDTDATYFWIQIKGVSGTLTVALEASNDSSPVTCADGDPLCYGDADKALRRYNTVVDADGERVRVCGTAVDATAKIIECDFPM